MGALRFRNYGKPSVLAVEETAEPRPGANEVIVQISAAGINRADVAAVEGAFKSTIPRTPGGPGDAGGRQNTDTWAGGWISLSTLLEATCSSRYWERCV